jgi:lambda family phage portal protein
MAGIIGRIAPGFAARRAEARLRLARTETAMLAEAKRAEILQTYDAARQGGRAAGWMRPHSSATTEIQPALPFLRASGRDLVRNSPHASRAVRVLASHIAGTGVRPRARVTSPERDTREAVHRVTQDEWDRFVENCDLTGQLDFYGQQRLMMRAVAESGEALRIWRPMQIDGRLRWRCEVIEGDMLDHQKNEVRSDGSRIIQGVEFDAAGRRAAYWLHERHPGERYTPGGLIWDVRRVPAEYVDHLYEVLRPGQVRGVSWFAPVAMVLRDLDDLAEAEVVRKKLEACIAMVVHNAHDDTDTGAAVSPATDDSGAALRTSSGAPVERMTPGMVLEARPGWGVEFNAPPASDGLVEHMKERLHAIAAGVGVTYFAMTGDMSQANYSSMRAGELEFSRLVEIWQADLMVTQSGVPAWNRVMEAARVNGELRMPVTPIARWTPPKRPWVDPQKDASAAILQMRAGLLSAQDVIERTGRTPEEVVADLREWREMTEGLDLEASPDRPTAEEQRRD